MTYPPIPSTAEIIEQFCRSVRGSERAEIPYRRWKLRHVLPTDICTGVLTLPIAPAVIGKTDGTRNTYDDQRCFFTADMLAKFPTCQALCEALQSPVVARTMAETCDIALQGGYLRIEYIQDTDGAWLEPHRDIPEKLFSMVIYLFTGPDADSWGTDIYDADLRWVGRSGGEFNSGVIFVAGPNTWHGFEPRPIVGVRRLMEVNYVRADWRDRWQLAFSDRPIRLD